MYSNGVPPLSYVNTQTILNHEAKHIPVIHNVSELQLENKQQAANSYHYRVTDHGQKRESCYTEAKEL